MTIRVGPILAVLILVLAVDIVIEHLFGAGWALFAFFPFTVAGGLLLGWDMGR